MKTILFRDSKWLVKFEIQDKGFTPEEIIIMKDKYNSELVLKQGNVLLFLEEIPELIFFEIGEVDGIEIPKKNSS